MGILLSLLVFTSYAKVGIELPPLVVWPQGVLLDGATGSQAFEPSGPVLLVLGYFKCPHACQLLLEGVRDLVKAVPESFEVWAVSLDPREGLDEILARERSLQWRESRPLKLFTLNKNSAVEVAKALGFHYEWTEAAMAHDVGMYVFGKGGRFTAFFPGTHFHPARVRLALVEASQFQQGDIWLKLQAALFRVERGTLFIRNEVWMGLLFVMGGLLICGLRRRF